MEQIKKATKETGNNCVFKMTVNDKNRAILLQEHSQPYPIKAILMPYSLNEY